MLFPLIDASFLGLTKHLKSWSAYQASQHQVLTSACLQLSAGAVFSPAFMSSLTKPHRHTCYRHLCDKFDKHLLFPGPGSRYGVENG